MLKAIEKKSNKEIPGSAPYVDSFRKSQNRNGHEKDFGQLQQGRYYRGKNHRYCRLWGLYQVPKKDDTIKGTVISFSPFGAFIEVTPKIRGLCHISEFAGQKEMEEALQVGKEYQFEILLIEPNEHRMSLKLKV